MSSSSSNFPPQLQLSLPPHTTSFKRSFEQFGFDLESPSTADNTGASTSGSRNGAAPSPPSDGNDRNKRPRSSSRSIDSPEPSSDSSHSSTASASSDTQRSALSATRPAVLNETGPQVHTTNSFLEVPRLPTLDLPDIEMMDYQAEEEFRPPPATTLDASDRLRLSLDRFNAFESHVSVIRGSRLRSPPSVQSPSPPPTLPPLSLSLNDTGGLNSLPNPFTLTSTEPSSASHPYLAFGSPGSLRPGVDAAGLDRPGNHMTLHELNGQTNPDRREPSPLAFQSISTPSLASNESPTNSLFPMAENGHTGPSLTRSGRQRDDTNPFRDHLDSALDIIRSHSPFFSEINDSRRAEDVRIAPLPRIRTQVDDDDRSWGVPWFNHPSANTSDPFDRADDHAGTSRTSTSPTASNLPPISRIENHRNASPGPPPARRSTFLGRARLSERDDTYTPTSPTRLPGSSYDTDTVNLERAHRDADAYLAQFTGGSRRENGNQMRTSALGDSSSDTDRFIANGLLDPHEENNYRRSLEPHAGGVRSSHTSSLHPRRSWGHSLLPHTNQRSDGADFFYQDQPFWWPSTLRRAMQSRSSSGDDWPTRSDARETRPTNQESPSSSTTEQRVSNTIWHRFLLGTSSSRDQLDEPTSPRFALRNGRQRRWSLSSTRRSGDSNSSESERRGETRPPVVNLSSADTGFSSSGDEDDGWFSMSRYPFNLNSAWDGRSGQDTAPQSAVPSRTPRALPVDANNQETSYPWLDLADNRTDGDNPALPSRLELSLQRRPSILRIEASNRFSYPSISDTPYPPEFHVPTDRSRRSSTASEHSGFWNTSTTVQQNMTGSEAETLSPQDDHWPPSRLSARDRLPRLRRPLSPPRVPFSLPTPDFSPLFDPLEGMDVSPPVSPHRDVHMGPQSWRRTSVSGSDNMFRLPPPAWEARPRQPSPLRLPMPRDMPRNSSIYRNIDLSAYTDGPFRTSLQGFMEPERIRPRPGRMESTEMGPGPSQPPSLPPLRFDYQPLPINLSPHPPTFTQARSSSSINSDHRMGSSFEERRANARFHSDQRLQETLRRRAPSPPSLPMPQVSPTSGFHRTRSSSVERRDSILSSMSRFPTGRNDRDRELSSRPYIAEPWPDSTRRDLFGRNVPQLSDESQEPAWVGWGDIEGESEPPRLSPFRRRFSRRSQDLPRPDRLFPEPSSFSSSSRPNPGPSTSRRRVSRSPARDNESIRDRIQFFTRNGIRNFRLRHNQDDTPGFRNRFAGDYIRDEDFDTSYESLLSLAAALGEVKPRVVPEHVLSSLPTALHREWVSPDSDKRCPICLEDYKPLDPVMKLTDCGHWLHSDCLKQWLRSACTCPVCRKNVREPRQSSLSEDPEPTGTSSSNGYRHNEEGGGSRMRRVSWAR